MTEAKSPREIAADITQWRGMFSRDQYRDQIRDAIEQALLSYAAERERLLVEADAALAHIEGTWCGAEPCPHEQIIATAITRHRSRLSSRPATEGKRDD